LKTIWLKIRITTFKQGNKIININRGTKYCFSGGRSWIYWYWCHIYTDSI